MIPSIIVDNFFTNPDKIRELALSLDYNEDRPTYPGVRAAIPEPYRQQIIEKILSLLFNLNNERVEWDIDLKFQKITKDHKGGWVHQDAELFTVIIYLSPESLENEGTCIYEPLIKEKDFIHQDDIRLKSFANNFSTEKENKQRLLFNSQFKTTLEVKNKYNRLFMYPGLLWHGVPEYTSDRLTLIMMVNKLNCNPLPLDRIQKYTI